VQHYSACLPERTTLFVRQGGRPASLLGPAQGEWRFHVAQIAVREGTPVFQSVFIGVTYNLIFAILPILIFAAAKDQVVAIFDKLVILEP
jgi:hypothetical protein